MVELLQALAPHFRAIAIDYPSHGHSDHIDWQPTIEDYARCVVEVMDALRIERAFAMGEAVGAATSIALGSRWPQRIDKAVLINIPYFSDADTAKNDIADIAKVRPSDESGFPAPRSIKFLLENDPEHAPMQPTQSWMDRINTAQLEIGRDRWQAMGALAKFDTLGGLAALKLPVLMLYGENFIYGKHRALMQSKCPHAKLEIVPGGRFCMSWERATDIAAHATHLPGLTIMSRDAIGRLNDALSRFGRVGLCTLPTPLEPMTRLSRHLGGPATVGQARGLHRSRLRRQQAAQARLRAARGAARGRRHAGLGRRGAIQQPAPGRGRGGEARARLPSRRLSRQAGTAVGRVWPHGQRAAQPPVRRHPARRAVERRSQRRHPRRLPRGCRARAARPTSCPTASPIRWARWPMPRPWPRSPSSARRWGSCPAPSPIARAAPARRPAWSSAPASACPRRASSASISTPSPSACGPTCWPMAVPPPTCSTSRSTRPTSRSWRAMPARPTACRTTRPSRRSGSAARLEALVLDPVYSGKGLAGLIALIRAGRWSADDDVVFLHTGGAPALFAYRHLFDPE